MVNCKINIEVKKTYFHFKSGPGGSIQAMKFDMNEESHLYTCSIDGKFCKRDLRSNHVSVYLDTGANCFK